MNVSEFSKKIAESGVVTLDVRTAEEIAEGYIEGSQSIDFYREDFEIEINTLDKQLTYAVYCRSGNRSGMAMNLLKQAGLSEVYNGGGLHDMLIYQN